MSLPELGGYIMTAALMFRIFQALCKAMGIQIMKPPTYQIGSEPAEQDVVRHHKRDGLYVEVLASFEEYKALREASNDAGLWFAKVSWISLKLTTKFIYRIFIVQKVGPEYRRNLPKR